MTWRTISRSPRTRSTPGTQVVDGLASIIQVGGIELIRIVGELGEEQGSADDVADGLPGRR